MAGNQLRRGPPELGASHGRARRVFSLTLLGRACMECAGAHSSRMHVSTAKHTVRHSPPAAAPVPRRPRGTASPGGEANRCPPLHRTARVRGHQRMGEWCLGVRACCLLPHQDGAT